MVDFSKLLFLPIDMPPSPDISDFLDSLTSEHYIQDTYRVSPSIMLMTKQQEWLPITDEIPEFKKWAEEELFTWTEKSQMVVIVTPPYSSMAPHIDCSPYVFNTWQHKFRHVIRGRSDTLRYITSDKTITVPKTNSPYIISGKWPHDMYNDYDNTKYTLCLGAPWHPGPEDEKYMKMLKRSYEINKEKYLSFEEESLPSNFVDFFNSELYPDAKKYFS